MDDFIALLIERYGWNILWIALIAYLAVEAALDVITDLIGDWIKKKIKK